MNKLTEAISIANAAHDKQTDKNNEPYIFHCLRVMEAVRKNGWNEEYQIVAVLHDILEDTNLTSKMLVQLFGIKNIGSIEYLTKTESISASEYIDRINKNNIATVVKYFDIMDNLSEDRMATLDYKTRTRLKKKYHNYLRLLKFGSGMKE